MREYDVTYITKEYLMRNGWDIVAYNPPGSQGTFTIPNPRKDHKYKGQTGSMSPDIIAYKNINNKNVFYIVESKSKFNFSDVKKMTEMFTDTERVTIFLKIIEGYALANEINFHKSLETEIRFAKAHSGDLNSVQGIDTILVNLQDKSWNPEDIDPQNDIYSKFVVTLITSS